MWLFVGLGNPGRDYEGHRHNIGFQIIDQIAADYSFPPFKSKFDGEIVQGLLDGEKVLLLKPQTYMNESGMSVGKTARFYKINPDRIVVFYDELDLPPGKLRVKRGGGSGGHNGIKSIDKHLNNNYYWRVRIGIGHPGDKDRVSGYVLSNFSKEEHIWLPDWLDIISKNTPMLTKGQAEQFMTKIARQFIPPNLEPKDNQEKEGAA